MNNVREEEQKQTTASSNSQHKIYNHELSPVAEEVKIENETPTFIAPKTNPQQQPKLNDPKFGEELKKGQEQMKNMVILSIFTYVLSISKFISPQIKSNL